MTNIEFRIYNRIVRINCLIVSIEHFCHMALSKPRIAYGFELTITTVSQLFLNAHNISSVPMPILRCRECTYNY